MSRVGLLLLQMDEVYARLRRRLEGLTDEEYLWEPAPGCWTIARLEQGRRLLRADLEGLTDPELDEPRWTNWGERWPAWRILWTMVDHDAHHGAEIGCLRDLYRVAVAAPARPAAGGARGPSTAPDAPVPAVSAGSTPSAARSGDRDQRDAHQQEPR